MCRLEPRVSSSFISVGQLRVTPPQQNTGEQFGEDSENCWGDAMGGGWFGGE